MGVGIGVGIGVLIIFIVTFIVFKKCRPLPSDRQKNAFNKLRQPPTEIGLKKMTTLERVDNSIIDIPPCNISDL